MLKKTITYTNFNDVEVTEDFYFHLSEAELTEMNYSVDGGMDNKLARIIDSKDERQIMKYFRDIVISAYGVKSDDGRLFVKNDEVRQNFVNSAAYSQIIMEIVTDEQKAADFINGILPKRTSDAVKAAAERQQQ